MKTPFVSSLALPNFWLFSKTSEKRSMLYMNLELTARCNNDCRHCYINLPAGDRVAESKELPKDRILEIVDEAVSLGVLWVFLTGGEPLLREDFADIYVGLKERGVLVSIFTNATLVRDVHVRLFKQYPPRDIEVTVYGIRKGTYERVTRTPGSYAAFMEGLDRLTLGGIPVRLKAMALRSNLGELPEIARFCRERTKDYFRFDPLLHLRYDGDKERNKEIESERLSPAEIAELDRTDPERFEALRRFCDRPRIGTAPADRLFRCGVGDGGVDVSYDGLGRLCASLWHPDCLFDLSRGGLAEGWNGMAEKVSGLTSKRREFLEKCQPCSLINLCMWCPANAYLECEELDMPVEYFCRVAHARADLLGYPRE